MVVRRSISQNAASRTAKIATDIGIAPRWPRAEHEKARVVGDVDVVLVGDDVDDAAHHAEHGERRDEGVDPQPRDDHAVDQADYEAREGSKRHGDERARAEVADRHRRDHAAEAEHGADRDVDAAGQDHQRLTERHDADRRGLLKDVDAVGDGEEGWRQDGEDGDQDRERGIEAEAGEPARRRHPGGAEARAGLRDLAHALPPVAASSSSSSLAPARSTARAIRPSRMTRMRSLILSTSGR